MSGIDAFENLWQPSPACHAGEFVLIQRVERDVDPAHTGCVEVISKPSELAAIGCHRQFFQGAAIEVAGHGTEERHNIAADKWFAASYPELFDAKANEGRAHSV